MENLNVFSKELDKILEYIISSEFESELDILSALVSEIVKDKNLDIIGGRVWLLDKEDNAYKLKSQFGDMLEIPLDFKQNLSDNHFYSEMLQLRKEQVLKGNEPNKELKKYGIGNYAGAGVGDVIHLENGKFFKYLLGFNANKFDDEFFDLLRTISRLATIAIRNYDSNKKTTEFNRDLYQAAEIQNNLLPDHYLEFHDYKIFGVCLPDRKVGGDYFDYIKNQDKDEEESVGILIADCASKGMSAAIQALFVSGAVRMAMKFSPKITNMMGRLNNLIHRTFSRERFVTMFYGELTLSSNRLILYANAGHCAPIHFRPSKDRFKELNPTGGFLGTLPHQKYKLENCRMMPGDTLLLYTDGISEAQNEQGELFGEDRLREIIKNNYEMSANEIAYKVLEEVQLFSTNSIYTDDKTVVVIKRDKKD